MDFKGPRDKEEAELIENISYGAHSTRDGVSLSRHNRQKPLVLPAEFSQLKGRECYLKLPGDYHVIKLQTIYQKTLSRVDAFLLKQEKKREYEAIEVKSVDTTEISQDMTQLQNPEDTLEDKESLL